MDNRQNETQDDGDEVVFPEVRKARPGEMFYGGRGVIFPSEMYFARSRNPSPAKRERTPQEQKEYEEFRRRGIASGVKEIAEAMEAQFNAPAPTENRNEG